MLYLWRTTEVKKCQLYYVDRIDVILLPMVRYEVFL